MVLDWRRQRHPRAARTHSHNALGWDKWKIMPGRFLSQNIPWRLCAAPSLWASGGALWSLSGGRQDHSRNLTHPRSFFFIIIQNTYSILPGHLLSSNLRHRIIITHRELCPYNFRSKHIPFKPYMNSLIKVRSWGHQNVLGGSKPAQQEPAVCHH